jgi:hypothetical protein
MITPEILARGSSGVTPALPRTPEHYLEPLPDKKTHEPPPPAFTTPRISANPDSLPAPAARAEGAPVKDTPASAAATVQALTPNTRQVIHEAPANQAVGAPAPAAVAAPAPVAAATVTRPLTPDEQKRIDKARKKEQEQAAREALAAAKLQEEQAKRDAEASAKLLHEQAEQAKRDADAAAKAAKKQAEIDRKRQKELDDVAKKYGSAPVSQQ